MLLLANSTKHSFSCLQGQNCSFGLSAAIVLKTFTQSQNQEQKVITYLNNLRLLTGISLVLLQ